jgi:hypothetical protein
MLGIEHIKGLMALQHLLANVGSPGQAAKLSTPQLAQAMINPSGGAVNPMTPSTTGVNIPLQNPPPAPMSNTNQPPQDAIDAINARNDLTSDQKVKLIKQVQLQQQKQANNVMYNLNPDGTPKTQ